MKNFITQNKFLTFMIIATLGCVFFFIVILNDYTQHPYFAIVRKRIPAQVQTQAKAKTQNQTQNQDRPDKQILPPDPHEKGPAIPQEPGQKKSGKQIGKFYQGRKIIGVTTTPTGDLQAVNQYNPKWPELLNHHLIRYMPFGTKITIEKKEALFEAYQNRGRFVEIVIVTTQMPSGEILSYNAKVDSQSGKILTAWNRKIHEWPKTRHGFYPSGTL